MLLVQDPALRITGLEQEELRIGYLVKEID